MISISIISPLKSMAVIDKAIEHNDFTNSVKTSPMYFFSPENLDTPIF